MIKRLSIVVLVIMALLSTALLATGCADSVDREDFGHMGASAGNSRQNLRNYRQDMRDFVQSISAYTKKISPNFIIIPQNGHELLTGNGEASGVPAVDYLSAIDGVGREDLFYGYNNDDVATPASDRDSMISFMDIAESNGIGVLVTDYCETPAFVDNSYAWNSAGGYLSFAADHRGLDNIPAHPPNPYHVNSFNVTLLTEAENFLYLIDPDAFSGKGAFLNAVRKQTTMLLSSIYSIMVLR